jgi:hypothetical protein
MYFILPLHHRCCEAQQPTSVVAGTILPAGIVSTALSRQETFSAGVWPSAQTKPVAGRQASVLIAHIVLASLDG